MAAIDAHPTLILQVVVTGMHLSPAHGRTVEAIRVDGFDIDRTVLMQLEGDSGAAMAASVGTEMVGMTTGLESLAPDAVVVLGDRGETVRGGGGRKSAHPRRTPPRWRCHGRGDHRRQPSPCDHALRAPALPRDAHERPADRGDEDRKSVV